MAEVQKTAQTVVAVSRESVAGFGGFTPWANLESGAAWALMRESAAFTPRPFGTSSS